MRRFYSPKEQFSSDTVELDEGETRHLRDVLRLSMGDEAQIFDGEGREFLCRIESVEKKRTMLRIVKESAPTAPESRLHLTFAAAITKGEKFDLVVQKAVELGVSRIVPLFTARCEVKPGGSDRRVERWSKIVLEASKQSGRARLMTIDRPMDFRKFAATEAGDHTTIMFSERDGANFAEVRVTERITAIIGPAGGWDDSELEIARSNGFNIVTFGGRILRAETAAIAFAAVLQHRFGDLN